MIDIQKLITELSIIGRITTGYKINTKGDVIILDNSTWYQGIVRTYRGDNRFQAGDCIRRIVDDSKKLTEMINDSSDEFMGLPRESFITIFTTALRRAHMGLERLSSTYNEDPRISEHINISIVIIKSLIKKLSCPPERLKISDFSMKTLDRF